MMLVKSLSNYLLLNIYYFKNLDRCSVSNRHQFQLWGSRPAHFLPIPLTSTTFWGVLMALSRTGSTDCMIPSLLHIVNLWLHALDGLHLSGDLNEWLSVIESLEDCSGKSLMDVLDGSGLGNGGVGITSGLAHLGGGEGGLELREEVILTHEVVGVGGDGGNECGGEFHL